jgi:hypothetical protein
MADLYNLDCSFLIVHGIDNAVITLTDPVPILSGEFFVPGRPWGVGQRANTVGYTVQIRFR